ncbi:MAG TPA: hypothetical protein VMW49_00625 [Candidatus Dormibacteraeota bacterium]|nr:hypothetical protein [Candidatus Dormibacteraeota bacterium]
MRVGQRLGPAACLAAAVTLLATAPVLGAARAAVGGHKATTATATGNDISYPQCGAAFPTGQAFGIVGLNGGLANDLNPCLGPSASYPSYTASELYWAVASSTGAVAGQPTAQLYLNTADPGNTVADWPTSGSNTYGTCDGSESLACAFEYGAARAGQDLAWLQAAASAISTQETTVTVSGSAAAYPWWLDVETANSWQSGTAGQAMNVADLQGMLTTLKGAGASVVGVYSTTTQWDQVTGGTVAGSPLYGLPDWIPGARRLAAAQSNCQLAPFTGGPVALTQWFSHPFDGDYAC